MLFGKYFALAMATATALFAGEADARRRKYKSKSKGWRSYVNRKCVDDFRHTLIVGGAINNALMTGVLRSIKKGRTTFSLALNGKDLVSPDEGKGFAKRNREFFRTVVRAKVGIAAFPWRYNGRLDHVTNHKVVQNYKKSVKAMGEALRNVIPQKSIRPNIIIVDNSGMRSSLIKKLHKKGFVIIGDTKHPRDGGVNPKNDRYIYTMRAEKRSKNFQQQLDTAYKTLDRRVHGLVDLSKCLGTHMYVDHQSKRN